MEHLDQSHFGPHEHQFNAGTFFTPGSHVVNPAEYQAEDDEKGKALFSGHVLTASMPLWQKVSEGGPINTSPEITRKELDALLHQSFQLGLKNEVAPVQVLELIRMRANEGTRTITIENIRKVVSELSIHLKCYG